MTTKETTAEILRMIERENARQLSLVLRMVRVVLGQGVRE